MRRIIVDGYNVIRNTPPYRGLAERDDFDAARVALVADVAAYAAGDFSATVVFDGAGNPLSDGTPHDLLGVEVIFSPHGQDADSVIEALSRSARDRGDAVEVVTSDAATQWAVMGAGVVRRSSSEFAGDLRQTEADWREHAPSKGMSVRVEDRIDASVRERLGRWARGEE